jgi:ribosomal protein S18 acetylase RimI-like enzyme
MSIPEPRTHIRLAHASDRSRCALLAYDNWGSAPAIRCDEQFGEYLRGGKYAPVFVVATNDHDVVIGFAAYHRTMLMKGSFDLIWIAVAEDYQGCNVGKSLTDWRVAEIAGSGGQMIQLVTQKPEFFSKFGFFKLHHLGNEWYLMLKLLTSSVDI